MKRKIIALLISIQIVASLMPVYAAPPAVSYQYDEDKEILSLSFDTDDYADTVLTLTLKNQDGGYAAIKELEAESGTAQVKLLVPQGSYILKAKRQDTLEECETELNLTGQVRAEIAAAAKKAIADKDAGALDKLAADYSSFLGMVSTDGAGALMIAAGASFNEADEFAAMYNGFAVAAALNAAEEPSALDKLLKNDSMAKTIAMDSFLPVLDGKNAYEYSSENVRSGIAEEICRRNDYTNLSEVRETIAEKTLFVNLRYGDTQTLTQILKAYADAGMISISWTEFSSLSSVLQRTVIEGMKGEYSSFSAVTAQFKTQLSKAKKQNSGSSSSSSSGGGGGGGGGTGVMSSFQYKPEPTPVPTAVPDVSQEDLPDASLSSVPVPKYIFEDMKNAKWAYEAVACLYRRGVVAGVSNNLYEPGRNVTRAEFTKMLINMFDVELPSQVQLPFTDVPESNWAYPYVACAYQSGIVYGMTDNYFGAGENVTREQAAVLIERFINRFDDKKPDPGLNVFIEFDDMEDASDWAKDSILYLLHISIIKGKENKNFKPKDDLTRAEAAMMLYSYLVVKGEEGK